MPLSSYDLLVCKLIDVLNGDILPLPRWGDEERNEQRVAMAVCEGSGMTPEHWAKLSETEREPWIEKAIERRRGASNHDPGLEQAEVVAQQKFDAAQALVAPVAAERDLRDLLWQAWNQINVPSGRSCDHPVSYRGWCDNLNSFCKVVMHEAATREGLLGRFLEAQSPNHSEQIALDLLRAGLLDSEQGIGRELAKLAQSDDLDWMKVFDADDLLHRILDPESARAQAADGSETVPIVTRFVAAAAKHNKAADEFERRMRDRGKDPALVRAIERGDWGKKNDAPKNMIFTDDPDWRAYKADAAEFDSLKREWDDTHPGLFKSFQEWDRAQSAEFQRVYGHFTYLDTSLNEAGQPNNAREFKIAQELKADRERYRREFDEWMTRLCAPPVPVPPGWEGEPPRYEITCLGEVASWLERELEHVRCLQDFKVGMGHDAGIRAINNLYRLFDQLRISDRPNAPTDPLDKIRAEMVLSNLLAWVRTRLSTDAQTKAISANGRPTPEGQTLPISPLDEFRGRVASAYKKLLFALDQDEREPLPDGDDGIPPSRANQLLEELQPLDANSAIGRAYTAARASVPDRDVPLVEEIYTAFWRVVENVMRGRSDAGENYRFQHALTMRPQIDREPSDPQVASPAQAPPVGGNGNMPAAHGEVAAAKPRVTKDQAHLEALRLSRNDRAFKSLSVHEMAERISCSPNTLRGTQFWIDLLKEQPQRQRSKGPTPKAVGLTKAVEANAVQHTELDPLGKLIADEEQAAIDLVRGSGMGDAEKTATIQKLQAGEMTTQQAIDTAKMFEPTSRKPAAPFKIV